MNFWKFHKDWRFLFTYTMMLTLLQPQLPKSKMNMGLRSDRPGPGVCKQQRERCSFSMYGERQAGQAQSLHYSNQLHRALQGHGLHSWHSVALEAYPHDVADS